MIRFAGIDNKNQTGGYSVWELLLYSLGLGPITTVLVLYYLILIFPSRTGLFYLSAISGFYLVLLVMGYKGFIVIYRRTKRSVKEAAQTFKSAGTRSKVVHLVYWGIITALLTTFLFIYTGIVKHNRIEGHDALIYANYGKMYLKMRQIIYAKEMAPAYNGFVFKGSPKPAFSLLLTWEFLLNGKDFDGSPLFDAWFRSISGYYALLIMMAAFLWLFRRNRWLAVTGVFLLLSSLGFLLTIIDFHLDSFRIFFLLIAWIWLAYAVKEGENPTGEHIFPIIMLGLFSGYAAFAHLIGLVAVAIIGIVFFLYYPGSFKRRFIYSALFLALVITFGGIHYILEAIYGSISGFLNYLL